MSNIAPIFYNRKRLSRSNIKDYLLRKYPEYEMVSSAYMNKLNTKNLLQKDYGEDMDCSLTSITECVMYHHMIAQEKELKPEEVYSVVESIAKNYFYNGKSYGTIPVFIKNIYDKTLKHFNLENIKTKQKYFKNIGYSLSKIKESLENHHPVIINIYRDGRDYYNDHSVTIVGIEKFELTNITNGHKKEVVMLIVQDHWTKDISYVDFEFISCISAVNY